MLVAPNSSRPAGFSQFPIWERNVVTILHQMCALHLSILSIRITEQAFIFHPGYEHAQECSRKGKLLHIYLRKVKLPYVYLDIRVHTGAID